MHSNRPGPSRPSRRRPIRLAPIALLALLAPKALHSQNLISNGDFDTTVAGWVAASGSLSYDGTEGATSGVGALSIFTSNSDSQARQCVTGIQGDTTYDFGGAFRLAVGDPLNFCRVQVEEYETGSCLGSSVGQELAQQIFVQQSASYASVASSIVTGTDTDALRVDLFCSENNTNHTVKWDDVFLVENVPEIQTFTLLAGLRNALFHMPGPNGQIGDGDDVISADPTSLQGSDPNYLGAFSFQVEQVPNLGTEPGLPDGFNRIRYIEGTIDVAGTTIVGSDIRLTGRQQGFGLETLTDTDFFDGLTGEVEIFDEPFPSPRGVETELVALLDEAKRLKAARVLFGNFARLEVIDDLELLIQIRIGAILQDVADSRRLEPRKARDRGVSPVADLITRKVVDVSDLSVPGTTVVYTVSVENDGPAAATNVLLRDRLPTETNYVGNDCGSPAPSGGIFSWDVGDLGVNASATCQVTMTVDLTTNFDFHNAATAYGDELDPDLDNNVAEVRVQILDDWVEGIDQRPNQQNGFQSDLSCTSCPTGNQAIADAFKVNQSVEICGVNFFGGYTGAVPTSDDFTIAIHEDNRQTPGLPGVPGAQIETLDGGLLARFPTGAQITGGFDEYSYAMVRINPPVVLPRGRYWLVITNDTGLVRGADTDWFWESADPDLVERGFPGVAFNPAFADASPGWGPNSTSDLAFSFCLVGVDPPDPSTIFSDGFESGDTVRWF